MKKRILVCAYFSKNIGDDLFLKALFERYPNVDWELLTADRSYIKTFNTYKNIKIIHSYRGIKLGKYAVNLFIWINKLRLRNKSYDAIVHIGGSIFMQNSGWQMKLAERNYLTNDLQVKKHFIIGANFGPFQDDCFINKYKDLFTTFDDICFRDSYSYMLFKDLAQVRLAPDVVLSLREWPSRKPEKVIGISVIQLDERKELSSYTKQYNQKIAQLIEKYAKLGYQVKLFSFCESEGDLKAIQSIKQVLDQQHLEYLHVINYMGDLERFLKEFKSCERIIGTRFHSLVLAMNYNQPFYPLIYSEKTKNFLTDLGFGNKGSYIQDMMQLNINQLTYVNPSSDLKDEQVFLDAHKQFEKLDKFMKNTSDT